MGGKEIPMEELGPVEEVRNDATTDPTSSGAAEAKTSKKLLKPGSCSSSSSISAQRRRLTGGTSLLRNLTRRGSFGSFLNESFDPSDPSAMGGQKLILKCPVQLTINSHSRSRFLFLYKDVLICAKQKSPTNFHTKHRIDLRDLWLSCDGLKSSMGVTEGSGTTDQGLPSEAEGGSDNCCLVIGWPTVHALVKFESCEERDAWRAKLLELMALAREKESPHTIVRIVQNDENYSVTKSMMVDRRETAKMVLARCMQEFHIPNETPSNFQLSVLKNRNDLPIPLTGQEVLYRIQMKQNREQLQESEKDTSAEMELELGEGLVFQLTSTEKKTNVLKRTLASEDGKPAKRASSLARFFRTTFRAFDEGKLFRRNLSELCKDGKLCWRLMMMLSHLFIHGPTFEEVFRKPPSIKVHRVLQDRLDRGKDFNFDKVNACEMSHLLKSFLNNLPECLLTFELYSEWAELSQMEDKSLTLTRYKSLVDQLPDCNRGLLRHLICVLHRIAINHHINGMPPKSLSICIGQCILWLPPLKPTSSEGSNDINKTVRQLGIANSVTETLIEYAREIFGADVVHLFDHLLSTEATALRTADIPMTFGDGMQVAHAVSDDVNKEPDNKDVVPDILSTADNCGGLGRIYSCLNHSTMSLNDEVKYPDLDRLREGRGREISLKLNSSWHLTGSGYVSKEYIRSCPQGLSLDSSHSSSQASYLDIFPDATTESTPGVKQQHLTDSPIGFGGLQTKRPHLEPSVLCSDNIDDAKNLAAKFYVMPADSPVLGESALTLLTPNTDSTSPELYGEDSTKALCHLDDVAKAELFSEDSTISRFSSECSTKPMFVSEDLTKPKSFSTDSKNHQVLSTDVNEHLKDVQEGRVGIGWKDNTLPATDKLLSANTCSISDSESSSAPMFIFPETVSLPSPLSAEQFATDYISSSSPFPSLSPPLQSPEKSPILGMQTPASPPSGNVTPLRSKPRDLVIDTPRLSQSCKTSTKSPLSSRTCRTFRQTLPTASMKVNYEGTPTPDDGYCSPLNSAKLSAHCGVGRGFELLPSKLEKNFQDYGKLNKRDESQSASQVSGEIQCSSYDSFSKSANRTELGTPTGIVLRLKSEITLRELSQHRPSQGPLSPNKEFSKELLRSSLSQPCKGSVLKSDSFSGSETSRLPPQDHSQAAEQYAGDKSCQTEPGTSPEMRNSRPAGSCYRRSQGCNRLSMSDLDVPGDRGRPRSSEPLHCTEILLHETIRCETQLDSPKRPAETNQQNSIHFSVETAAFMTSPSNDDNSNMQPIQASPKAPLSKCASLPLKSPVTPALAAENTAQPVSMDYEVLDKSTSQWSKNYATVARRTSPTKDSHVTACDNVPENGADPVVVENPEAANESNSSTDTTQTRNTKRRLCNSEPTQIVTFNSSRHEIERSKSDTSGIASKMTAPEEERLNEANKENLSRYQLLKRISGTVQSSTPEKLWKRCEESVDSAVKTTDEDDAGSKSPDIHRMSVKNRDWHKELLEQYTKPSPTSSNITSSSPTQSKTATKNPGQRLAVLAPKICYTPMPLLVYQGSASKQSKGADKLRKP